MVRPPSSSKAAKPRGGADAKKRKRGGGPQGGGPGGRPAKQIRNEGKRKPVDNDVYEAEDSDPDEVKHAERFDKVDNYEYELPSDFEDEEIDEELAFTKEDKKKFGSWFGKEVSSEDGEAVAIGDDDGEDLDSGDGTVEDEEGENPVKLVANRGRGHQRAGTQDRDEGIDDILFDDDDDNPFSDDEAGDMNVHDEDEEERHRAMIYEVLGGAAAVLGDGERKRAVRDPNAAVLSEAYPESEYNLNPEAASAGGLAARTLSVVDLLRGLTDAERRKLGPARRFLEKVAGAGVQSTTGKDGKGLKALPVPLPAVVAERQERKAGYEAASRDVTKWQSIVKANREAPTLRLVSGGKDLTRVTTTAGIVANHTPSEDNALEAEVAALLAAAGADNAEAIDEAEEKLALKALSFQEAKDRRDRLAKLRSLLFYHEVKARRLKAIKSKEYHRHLAKAAKRKAARLTSAAAEAGGDGNPGCVDAERVVAIEAEYQRAKERLTLRHRNSSRWARRALKRGQLQMDEGTKAALAEQLQLGQQLKRKIEGRKGDGGDDGTSDSDGDGPDVNSSGVAELPTSRGRIRSAALALLKGNDPLDLDAAKNASKKGLLGLPFMKRALDRRRIEAQQEAEQVLKELDEDEVLHEIEDDDGEGMQLQGMDAVSAARGSMENLVGYGIPLVLDSGVAGRRKFDGVDGKVAPSEDPATEANDHYGESDVDSDGPDEDAQGKAERLGRPTQEAALAAAKLKLQQQRIAGVQAKLKALPTAADEADLDQAIAAGAVGRGMLVASSEVVDVAVPRQPTATGGDTDERRKSGLRAGTRLRPANIVERKGVMQAIMAQQASLAPGGGRAALFDSAALPASGGKEAEFIASKKFCGARKGYAFRKGTHGVGYYLDSSQAAAAVVQSKVCNNVQRIEKHVTATVAGMATKEPEKSGKEDKPCQQRGKLVKKKGASTLKDSAASAVILAGGEDDDDAPMMQPAAASQQDLIRQAFANDDVESEFAAEKATAVGEELPKIDEPSALPGWGAWSTQQHNPRWMQAAKEKAAKIRVEAASSRKDANLKYVIITERYDKKSDKYKAPSAPLPFMNNEAYERSLRQPLGRDFNPDAAFRDLTRPAVLKQAGLAIAPLRYSESLAKEFDKRGKKAELKREDRRVMTVVGGLSKLSGAKK